VTATLTPFALLVADPEPPTDRTPAHTYDRLRQLNITPAGDAVVDVADVWATTMTHNNKGFKRDDDFADATPALVGPTMTHNSTGLKKDDD
jgi:hypothetical protein